MASVESVVPLSLARELAHMLVARPWGVALIDAKAKGAVGAKTQHIADFEPFEVKTAGYARLPLNARVEDRNARPAIQFDNVSWTCEAFTSGCVLYLADSGAVGAVLAFGGKFAVGAGSPLVIPFDAPIRF